MNKTRGGWGKEGFSPLHEAACAGHVNMCRLLCECDADKDLRDFYGKSALHLACEGSNVPAAQVLLQYGCDPALQDLSGCTPLSYAVKEGLVELVDSILDLVCTLDAVDSSNRTALHIASDKGYEQIVRRLLEAGACFHVKDHCGWTPLEYAMSRGHMWCIFYLFLHGHPLPAPDCDLHLLENMILNNEAALALLLQLGWRPKESQLNLIKFTLSSQDCQSDQLVDIRQLVEEELQMPSSLLKLSSHCVINSLAKHLKYKSITSTLMELEVPYEILDDLQFLYLQQFMFSV